MQTGTEILEAPLTVFTDTPDEDDTIQSNDSGGTITFFLIFTYNTWINKAQYTFSGIAYITTREISLKLK